MSMVPTHQHESNQNSF